jgi:hypothetical protein
MTPRTLARLASRAATEEIPAFTDQSETEIPMRFLSIYKAAETGVPPTQEHMDEMGRLIEEMQSAGVLLATEGCLPSALGARVRLSGGEVTVTDGPFTESKELIAGYTIIQVKSREEAMEWTRRFPNPSIHGKDGEIEVRQLFELEDFGESEAIDRFKEMGVG